MGHMHAVACGNPACSVCYQPPDDILNALNADDYKLGSLQALPYLPHDPLYSGLFYPDWLSVLYLRMRTEHLLERAFCGMIDLTHDTVVSYLHDKTVIALVRWNEDGKTFDTLGFAHIVSWVGIAPPTPGPRSAIAGYAFFRQAHGSPDMELLAMLGLARMFRTYRLSAVIGQRSPDNFLTARFMSRFGFRDLVTIPEFMLDNTDALSKPVKGADHRMIDCTVSRLTRKDFVLFVEETLIRLYTQQCEKP